MTLTLLKILFKKQKPRVLNYCKHKFYNNIFFREQFLSRLSNKNLSKQDDSLERFQDTFFTVLNSIAPLKSEFMRANQTPLMNKELQQTIMIRSRLRNNF